MDLKPLCSVQFGPETARVVATLGDKYASTCSVEFAKTWLAPEGGLILGYASFEAASEAVLRGDAKYLLVPGAYPAIGTFIFDAALETADQFRDLLPTIVLVSGEEQRPAVLDTVARLYYHPALRDVADELEARWHVGERVEVSSNPVACERALADREALALTNAIAARAYGVYVREAMREGRRMPCVVFEKQESRLASAKPDLRPWLGPRPAARPHLH